MNKWIAFFLLSTGILLWMTQKNPSKESGVAQLKQQPSAKQKDKLRKLKKHALAKKSKQKNLPKAPPASSYSDRELKTAPLRSLVAKMNFARGGDLRRLEQALRDRGIKKSQREILKNFEKGLSLGERDAFLWLAQGLGGGGLLPLWREVLLRTEEEKLPGESRALADAQSGELFDRKKNGHYLLATEQLTSVEALANLLGEEQGAEQSLRSVVFSAPPSAQAFLHVRMAAASELMRYNRRYHAELAGKLEEGDPLREELQRFALAQLSEGEGDAR